MAQRLITLGGGIAAAAAAIAFAGGGVAAARPGNLCGKVPIVNIQRNDLGFRVGWPQGDRPGSRGHAKVDLQRRTVSGIMCQTNRDGASILLSIGHRLRYASHHAVMFGVPGNIVVTGIRVTRTTDPSCPVGTRGSLTVFASYNNVVNDSVQLRFPHGCTTHRHHYTGRSVVTNVPPN